MPNVIPLSTKPSCPKAIGPYKLSQHWQAHPKDWVWYDDEWHGIGHWILPRRFNAPSDELLIVVMAEVHEARVGQDACRMLEDAILNGDPGLL